MTASLRLARRTVLACFALASVLTLSLSLTASARAEVQWSSEILSAPTNLPPGSQGMVKVHGANVGDTASSSYPTITVDLPTGVTVAPGHENNFWSCTGAGTSQATCTFALSSFSIGPKQFVGFSTIPTYVLLVVDVASDAPEGPAEVEVTMEGGGGAAVTEAHEVRIGSEPLFFGPTPGSFTAGAFTEEGSPDTRAGGHPYEASASFKLNTKYLAPTKGDDESYGTAIRPASTIKDIITDLPAGFAGNPNAAAECPNMRVVAEMACPPASQVGVVEISPPVAARAMRRMMGVYNLTPSKDTPAQFGFVSPVGPVLMRPVLRGDGAYGLSVHVKHVTQVDLVLAVKGTFWGVPADPSHDAQRCAWPNYHARACVGYDEGGEGPPPTFPSDAMDPHSTDLPRRPFLTNPTRCTGTPDETFLHVTSWPNPGPYQPDGDPEVSNPAWVSAKAESPALTGCELLEFEPSMKARPTTNATDSPSGLEVDLHMPQNEDPDGLATAHLRKAVVTLPEGLVVNPAGANGLGACTPEQIGLTSPVGAGDPAFDRNRESCPNSSRIGSVSVETPLLDAPLEGSVYVATPHENPFGSLLAIYITAHGPGIVAKLAGDVSADPKTGRLTTVVDENPQVPFEDFHLDFFGGATASLRTPATCGTKTTTSELTPWSAPHSGPPVTSKDSWALTQGPNGAPCASTEAELPNSPGFEAGSSSPIAGAHSPFVIDLSRADGTQQFGSVTVSPPRGLLAKLAGTAICPDSALAAAAEKDGKAEQASPSCPPASEVGSVIAGAGAGPAPYYASGKAYIAGPYKGAPMSLAIVTPAVAGPFNLGTIVVRTALRLDPVTAQITATSDSIPTILEGIPLDVRSVQVRLDRPRFTLNPTSCEKSAVGGQLISTLGQSANLVNPFQVGECGRLGFKPRLKLSLKGGKKRGDHPGLRAVLRMPAGSANMAKASVTLPGSEILENAHIRTICTRPQFAADACPKGAVYGKAVAHTPLLAEPVRGPVYLRANGGERELPDLVAALRGPDNRPIEVELVGYIDSVRGRLRNRFVLVPDAPVSKFVLTMQGGKRGLLVNSTNICRGKHRAAVLFTAHNGKERILQPELRASRCGKK